MTAPQNLSFSPYEPYDPTVFLYQHYPFLGNFVSPFTYSGWRDEILSWKEGVGLHAQLSVTPTSVLRGPDVLRFLSDISVNSFAKFPVGAAKHVIMCNPDGHVMVHGMVVRIAEDAVSTYWLEPYVTYRLQQHPRKYDVQAEDITNTQFLFQVAGPRSLETLEAAAGENLHDIRFMRHRRSAIAGSDVRVLRIGMAGTLGYEVHGQVEDAHSVHRALTEAGEQFGIRRLTLHSYMLSHTQNGFPQWGTHFTAPWWQDEEFMAYLTGIYGAELPVPPRRGSATHDIAAHFRNPVELGWGHMIKLDHEFTGRASLERELESPSRAMVTLEWNTEDVLDVEASQYEPGEHYLPFEQPHHAAFWSGGPDQGAEHLWADNVLDPVDGAIVGISSGRVYSYPYRRMLSLASVELAYARDGNELIVVWGEHGTRQKRIRARVARFPYMNEDRNENVDVSTIQAPTPGPRTAAQV